MPDGFSRNLWPELIAGDEWHSLEAGQALAVIYILFGEDTPRHGIKRIRYSEIIRQSRGLLDRQGVDDLLQLLEHGDDDNEFGWIVRDGRYLWIPKYIQLQGNSPNWVVGALREARELLPSTSLAQLCIDRYGDPSGSVRDAIVTPSKRRSNADETTDSDSDSGIKESSPGSADAEPAPPARKRIKPKPPTLEDELQRLPTECKPAWDRFAAMAASHNKTETISDTRLAGLLADILNRCQDMPPGAVTYGLLAACQAGDGKGAPNARYVFKCADGWNGRAHPLADELPFAVEPEQSKPPPPDGCEIDPELAAINDIPEISELKRGAS